MHASDHCDLWRCTRTTCIKPSCRLAWHLQTIQVVNHTLTHLQFEMLTTCTGLCLPSAVLQCCHGCNTTELKYLPWVCHVAPMWRILPRNVQSHLCTSVSAVRHRPVGMYLTHGLTGQVAVAESLLSAGADVAATLHGETAAEWAAKNQQPAIVELFAAQCAMTRAWCKERCMQIDGARQNRIKRRRKWMKSSKHFKCNSVEKFRK